MKKPTPKKAAKKPAKKTAKKQPDTERKMHKISRGLHREIKATPLLAPEHTLHPPTKLVIEHVVVPHALAVERTLAVERGLAGGVERSPAPAFERPKPSEPFVGSLGKPHPAALIAVAFALGVLLVFVVYKWAAG